MACIAIFAVLSQVYTILSKFTAAYQLIFQGHKTGIVPSICMPATCPSPVVPRTRVSPRVAPRLRRRALRLLVLVWQGGVAGSGGAVVVDVV